MDLKELLSAVPFPNEWQWSNKEAHQHPPYTHTDTHFGVDKGHRWVGLVQYSYSLHILLHKVHCDQDSLPTGHLSPSFRLIKRGSSRQWLELSASRGGELFGADNNTKWIFSNTEKQLSSLFECFTFPRTINWLFDHRQRCTVTDKEEVISKVAWRT